MNWSDRLEELVLTQEQRDAFLERMRVQVDQSTRRIIVASKLSVSWPPPWVRTT